MLPLYYLADATLTLLRRIGKREPFWAAHRSHFYQRATDNGFTTPQVVVHVFLLNIVLAALAFASIRMNSAGEGFVFLLTGALLVGFVLLRFSLKKPS